MTQEFWDAVDGKLHGRLPQKTVLIGAALIIGAILIISIRMFSASAMGSEVSLTRSESSDPVQTTAAVASKPNEEPAATVQSSPNAEIPSAAKPASLVAVYVSGAVCKPDVYELEDGARIVDAVLAAGGFSDDAQTEALNLAQKVSDGQHVHVPRIGDETSSESVEDAAAQEEGSVPASSGLVNINTASASELEQLPGIGAATAQKIIADRTQNGSFSSVDDLTRVSGIGEKKLEGLRDLACV